MFQIVAISQQGSETDETSDNKEETSNPLGWKSFDMRSVAAATEDIFDFILSKKGARVRVFLLRDIIKAADTFLEDQVVSRFYSENFEDAMFQSEVSHSSDLIICYKLKTISIA